jgi:hypothetical protein
MKRTGLAVAALAALGLGACAYHGPARVGVVAGNGYYDGYYDGYYGPFYDGYWGTDGAFWYSDGGHRWHRDRGHHFRRDNGGHGWNHVRGSGRHRDH